METSEPVDEAAGPPLEVPRKRMPPPLPGDKLEIRLVIPRAISAAGKTTTAAPYNADSATRRSPVNSHASAAATTPTTNCDNTTRQGETGGSLSRRACAS